MCTSTIIKKESLVKNPIVILGGGPSGVVCATGLKKLGFNVILISKKRPFDDLEGFSHRTIGGRISPRNSQKKSKETVSYLIKYTKKMILVKHLYIHQRKDGYGEQHTGQILIICN